MAQNGNYDAAMTTATPNTTTTTNTTALPRSGTSTASINGTCPRQWGSTDGASKKLTEFSHKVAVVLTGSKLPCSGRLLRWEIVASMSGDVTLVIVRPVSASKSSDYYIRWMDSYSVTKGNNSLHVVNDIVFDKDEMVAFIAAPKVLHMHEGTSKVTIFHIVTLANGILKHDTAEDTNGHFKIMADIQDYDAAMTTTTTNTTASSRIAASTSSRIAAYTSSKNGRSTSSGSGRSASSRIAASTSSRIAAYTSSINGRSTSSGNGSSASSRIAASTSSRIAASTSAFTTLYAIPDAPVSTSIVTAIPSASMTAATEKSMTLSRITATSSLMTFASTFPIKIASTPRSTSATTSSVTSAAVPCIEKCGGRFTNWGECSSSCGVSNQTRFLICENEPNCENIYQTQPCSMIPCKVDGAWSSWSIWSICNKSCEVGSRTRNRTCTNPSPKYGGYNCSGISEETLGCNYNQCPVNGGLSQWSTWSGCDQPCGNGRERIFRECNSPLPAFGGRNCEGALLQMRACNTHQCQTVNVSAEILFANESINMISLAAKFEDNLRGLYHNSSTVIKYVVVHNSSVAVNFTVVLWQSATDEIVTFRHALEDVRVLHTMQVKAFKLLSTTVSQAPALTNTTAVSSTSILVDWAFAHDDNITGFMIYFKEYSAKSWHRVTVTRLKRQHLLTKLLIYTLYTIRISASTRNWNGIPSGYSDCATLQGVPDRAPERFTCQPSSSETLLLEWSHLLAKDWHGSMAGYVANYRTYNGKDAWQTLKTSSVSNFSTISGLKPFRRYEIKLAAFTDAGDGPFSWQHCKTDEAAALRSPSNVAGELLSRDGMILVTWKMLFANEAGGIPIAYVVYYKSTKRGSLQNANPIQKSLTVSRYTNRAIIGGFPSYTEVAIEVSARTVAGEGPRSTPIYIVTCRCPRNIYASWYPKQPLIHGSPDRPQGVFAEFIVNSTLEICRICDGSVDHSLGGVRLFFNKTKDGKRAVFENEDRLKSRVAENAHIFLPINGNQDVDVFQRDYKFLLVSESPGSVLLTKDQTSSADGKEFINLVLFCWPPLSITLLLTMVFGILVWIADRRRNPEFSISSFLRGSLSGFWWGIITMTTVGYGDFTPRSVPARMIAIVWMLIGPILGSILIGAISTSMTSIQVKEGLKLYGTSVAVKANSFEYFLAVRRNARLSVSDIFHNNSDVIEALVNGRVKGALMDSLSAATMQGTLNEKGISVAQSFSQVNGYGLVLSSDFIPLEENLRSYLSANKELISVFMSSYNGAIQESAANDKPEPESIISGLQNNATLIPVVIACTIISVVVVILKKLLDFILLIIKRRKNAQVLPENKPLMKSLECLEKDITEEYEKSLTRIEQKIDELVMKHHKQILLWFSTNKNLIGVPIWLKLRMLQEQKRVKVEQSIKTQLRLQRFGFDDQDPPTCNINMNFEERLPTKDICQDERLKKCFPIKEESEK